MSLDSTNKSLNMFKNLSEPLKKMKEKKKNKRSVLVAASAHNSQNAQLGLVVTAAYTVETYQHSFKHGQKIPRARSKHITTWLSTVKTYHNLVRHGQNRPRAWSKNLQKSWIGTNWNETMENQIETSCFSRIVFSWIYSLKSYKEADKFC